MLSTCRCAACNKELSCDVEGFDGKKVWINMEFTRLHSMCNECKNMSQNKNFLSFCSLQCLKDYVMDPDCLDKFFEDEVMWGRLERCMKTGEVY